MQLEEYFTKKSGTGVLSTADKNLNVNSAIYSRPHVLEKGVLAFIMRERLTYSNMQENDSAVYLFLDNGGGYSGVRLYLSKIDESVDEKTIQEMTRRHLSKEEDKVKGPKHIVFFSVDKILPLIGAGDTEITT